MKCFKFFIALSILSTIVFSQSHQVGDWKIPRQGYLKDSVPNWATLIDSILSHYAARNRANGKCSLNNVLRLTGNPADQYSEFLLRLDGLNNDAGILLTPDTGTSSFIDFAPDLPNGPGKRGRIGRNPYNQGSALFTGIGGYVNDALQIGQRDGNPVQLFTADNCRLMVAGSGNVGISLPESKYDSLENNMPQALWVYGGGIRSQGGFYEGASKVVSSPWTTPVNGRVDFDGNIRSTASAGSIEVANGNVFLYGDNTQSIFSLVPAGDFIIRTTNVERMRVSSTSGVTLQGGLSVLGVASRNYADSAAAYAAGMRSGSFYHTNGVLKIMY